METIEVRRLEAIEVTDAVAWWELFMARLYGPGPLKEGQVVGRTFFTWLGVTLIKFFRIK